MKTVAAKTIYSSCLRYTYQAICSDGQIVKHNYYKIHNGLILAVYTLYMFSKILILESLAVVHLTPFGSFT